MRNIDPETDIDRLIIEKLLPAVQKPSQYVGVEINARNKDPLRAETSFVIAFPDAYEIGISHLGSRSLYHSINDLDYAAADRTYCPLVDAEKVMRKEGIPLFGWESRYPVGRFDAVGFSMGYELCVTNVLTMLDLSGIPLESSQRRDGDPLVIGGNEMADSPESMAKFIDVFLPGDGEVSLVSLAEIIRKAKASGIGRDRLLEEIATGHPAAYVPRFYSHPEPWPAPPRPAVNKVPEKIGRGYLEDLADTSPSLVTRPIVPHLEGVHDRLTIEIMRGCPNSCRFCQAGWLRRPVRYRKTEDIIECLCTAIDATGYDEISLLSLSSGDYPGLDKLIDRLNSKLENRNISISLPSLKFDTQLALLPKLTSTVRRSGFTVAAEAGSERMRKATGKNINETDMLNGVSAAWAAGYRSIKVYFMAGLPGETEDDVESIVELCKKLSNTRRSHDGHRGSITASVSWFVPKPHTPMQWEGMKNEEYMWQTRKKLKELARGTAVQVKFHRIEQSLLEAFISRSGPEAADTILAAWRGGARMDAWREHWDWKIWQEAISKTGADFERVVYSSLDPGLPLPWSHVSPGIKDQTLIMQRDAMNEVLAGNW